MQTTWPCCNPPLSDWQRLFRPAVPRAFHGRLCCENMAVLSCCPPIGPLALQQLFGRKRMSLRWDVTGDCVSVNRSFGAKSTRWKHGLPQHQGRAWSGSSERNGFCCASTWIWKHQLYSQIFRFWDVSFQFVGFPRPAPANHGYSGGRWVCFSVQMWLSNGQILIENFEGYTFYLSPFGCLVFRLLLRSMLQPVFCRPGAAPPEGQNEVVENSVNRSKEKCRSLQTDRSFRSSSGQYLRCPDTSLCGVEITEEPGKLFFASLETIPLDLSSGSSDIHDEFLLPSSTSISFYVLCFRFGTLLTNRSNTSERWVYLLSSEHSGFCFSVCFVTSWTTRGRKTMFFSSKLKFWAQNLSNWESNAWSLSFSGCVWYDATMQTQSQLLIKM